MKLLICIALISTFLISSSNGKQEENPPNCIDDDNKGGKTHEEVTYNSGYIFTSPRTLKNGGNNELNLRRIGDLSGGNLHVQVLYKKEYNSENETVAASEDFEIPDGEEETILNLYVKTSDDNVYSGRIQINGSLGNREISGSDDVSFSTRKKNIIIIQTDKPLYKPGETVKFRVLKLNKFLKPTDKNNSAEVFVEDTKGTRLFQFENLDLQKGLVQRDFPLSDEPVLGRWSIRVKNGDTEQMTTFEVKEYVLPKFEVTIKFPSFVLATTEIIPVDICANYTYGKPVKGLLNLNASFERYYYERNGEEKYPILQETIKIDGCYTYELNVTKIESDQSYYNYRRIVVMADVQEEGTGVEKTDTQYIRRDTSPLNLDFIEGLDYFKPGLPYNGKLKVSNPDNTIAPQEPIEICVTINKKRILADWWATKTIQICQNYTSCPKGLVSFTILPQNTDVISMNLEAKSLKYAPDKEEGPNTLSQPQTSKYLSPFFSPSSSFIQIQPIHQPVECGTQQTLKLLFTSKENSNYKFYYQVTRQSKIIVEDSIETYFSDENDVSSQYENENRIINGSEVQLEPPTDSIPQSSVDECPEAKESRYLPPIGEIDITIDASINLSPTIYVLVYYVKDDGEVVADSMKINIENCFQNKVDFAFGYDAQQPGAETPVSIKAGPNSLCGIKAVDKSILLLDNSDQLTKEKVFQMVANFDNNQYYPSNPCYQNRVQPGLENAAVQKLVIPFPPVGSSSNYEDSLSAFQTSGLLVISDLYVFTRPCDTGYSRRPPGRPIALHSAEYASAPTAFAANGAIKAKRVGPGTSSTQSISDVRSNFPETWLFDLEMTNEEGTFEKDFKLPDTITKWVGSAVCVNSEDGLGISNTTSITAFQAFFIDYTLPISVIRGEEFVVVVSISSYTEGALPITVTLEDPDGFEIVGDSINGDICVHPDSSVNLPITLKATKVGKVQIIVNAETAQSSGVCGNSVTSDSYAKDAIMKPIEVEAEGFFNENVINTLFCPSDNGNNTFDTSITLSLPDDVVPDSSRAYMDFTGNVLGPAINNLNNLVSLPTGCGEQNMVKFTPNYLVLDYLKDIGMLDDNIKNKAIRNLNTGYQRELRYRHSDGSFSAFGETDREGSMFLTAFVLRSFYEAKRYIYVDDNLLKQMQDWMVSKQSTNGCFPNIGRIVDIGLQGGFRDENSSGSITAYVLASLLITQYDNKTVIDDSFNCLKENPPTNPYSEFLYAYAYSLDQNTPETKNFIEAARQKVNRTEGMESFIIVNGTKAIEIETVAYAVLTTLCVGGTASEALPYIRYLTTNLNPNGGFSSTQDTCIGLEALASFAKRVYKDPLDLSVTVSGGLEKNVQVSNDNKLLVQRFKVDDISTTININAEGTGCGLIQTDLRYNTRVAPEKKKFSLGVMGECSDPKCNTASIEVLTSYLPEGQVAGMSIVEVKLITGFSPVKQSLENLKSDKNNNILRVDVKDNTVIIYFSEISNAVEKFSFEANQVVKVRNSQPGTAKVYDYYANENSASTSYTITSENNET